MTPLTARRRAVLAIVVSWPLGYLYLAWSAHLVVQLLDYYRNGITPCSHGGIVGLADRWNRCQMTSFSVASAIAELVALTALAIGVSYGLSRWVVWPVRAMAATVAQLGPDSLGVRIRPSGPPDETHQLGRSVDALLDRVAEAYEAQRRFAANASHELRTPLATQRALIEVSLGSTLTPEQTALLSRQLLATNERNERLIEGLLVLAETDRGVLHRGPQRLDAIADRVVDTLRPAADGAGLRLRSRCLPCTVPGEQPLLERLVLNLVQNALKYNTDGGRVEVSLDETGRFTVVNTGPVVPPEQVDGLFEPFRRGSGDRLDHSGGAGLGLTIVRSIVSAHGGSVVARANPGGGLTVQVQLAGHRPDPGHESGPGPGSQDRGRPASPASAS